MIPLADVIQAFEGDLLSRYGPRLAPEQRHALSALRHCRSAASPKMQLHCPACAHQRLIPHSCGHRLCPHCQRHEGEQWLARQQARRVPAGYFLLTFTLPAEFRPLARAHPRVVYEALMGGGWQTLRSFSENDRQLRGTPGAIAVLHTHSRRLEYHPHVHLVVPGAAVDAQARCWRTKGRGKNGSGYLFNGRALAKVFRAKLLAALEAAGLALPNRYPPKWVVHCKAVGSGEKALVYLGRYLYRGVIREADILACGDGQVRFRYRDAKTGKLETRTLEGAAFLWLLLQHVLPKGFRRARNYGFLHPNAKALIALLQLLLQFQPAAPPVRERPPVVCPCCGAVMVIVATRLRGSAPPRAAPPPGSEPVSAGEVCA